MLAGLSTQLRPQFKIPTLFNFIINLRTSSNKENNIYKIYISFLSFTFVQRIMYCNIPMNSLFEIKCMIFFFLNYLFYLLNFILQTSHLVWMPTKVVCHVLLLNGILSLTRFFKLQTLINTNCAMIKVCCCSLKSYLGRRSWHGSLPFIPLTHAIFNSGACKLGEKETLLCY